MCARDIKADFSWGNAEGFTFVLTNQDAGGGARNCLTKTRPAVDNKRVTVCKRFINNVDWFPVGNTPVKISFIHLLVWISSLWSVKSGLTQALWPISLQKFCCIIVGLLDPRIVLTYILNRSIWKCLNAKWLHVNITRKDLFAYRSWHCHQRWSSPAGPCRLISFQE